jgi:hypothetical protein
VPLRAFPDRDSGEAYRRDLDRLARRWLSPFQLFHGQMDVMRRTEEEICQAISVLGLPAPLPVPGSPSDASITQRRDLAGWWDQHVARMTEEQFDAVWALCDRVRLYTVAEVALDAEG